MAKPEYSENSFFLEREHEDINSGAGRSVRVKSAKFGFGDKYGGKLAVESRPGDTVIVQVNETGKWHEEDSTSTVYFPDLETFTVFVAQAVEFVANEQEEVWPRYAASNLNHEATLRTLQKQDGPVIKFREGQLMASGPVRQAVTPWPELAEDARVIWRNRHKAALRDLGLS